MRIYLVALTALISSSCSNDTPPSAYKHAKDKFWAATGLYGPCFRTIDGQPGRLPDADCYRFGKPHRMRGVAVTGFESGSFYLGRTTQPGTDDRSDYWLDLDPRILPRDLQADCKEGCIIDLDFIGRRTAVEGAYGHLGSAKHLIIIDRLLAAKILKRPEGIT